MPEQDCKRGTKIHTFFKGVSPEVKTGKLKWKISDTDVAGIKKRRHNKATFKVWEDGNTTVTVIYKGKKYKCHVKAVPRDYYTDEEDTGEGNISAKPELSATAIELQYIEDYAVPYIGKNPAYQYEYTFRVRNYSASAVKWSIEGDKQARDRYRINDSGKIYMFMGNDINEAYSDCTVVAKLSDGSRLKAEVIGYDDGTT